MCRSGWMAESRHLTGHIWVTIPKSQFHKSVRGPNSFYSFCISHEHLKPIVAICEKYKSTNNVRTKTQITV